MMSYPKMDPEAKQRWLTALRSGDYTQGRTRLNYNGRYCCLGVLCEVEQVSPFPLPGGTRYEFPDGSASLYGPPAGFRGLSEDTIGHLISLNDEEEKSFTQIADWIEANL